ncbi:S-layer homology domain-containing protein [Cohnella sp. AR92]|uniref:S-layer homology domain-containing protein n=1 Tax=Cohnella sp. AR92 TaxID=648716 RepID=UPI000F8C9023|nr:S-layer homology domain-containing protein [Cohnella sp. AR92]RUS48373.1 S-layer homology domain-containing protein [Cohnella sp. AR92]
MAMKPRKTASAIAAVALSCVLLSGSAFAFSDIEGDPGSKQILDLRDRGIVQGVGNNAFKPQAPVNGATALTLIVKGLGLNIDNKRFFKEPKASDYFSIVKDNAPYAMTFIIAKENGLDIPKDIDPAKKITREQFAHWLFQAISTKGDYAYTEQYMLRGDEDKVTPAFSGSIQKLLIAGIAQLDKKQNFRPQDTITRSEAAILLDNAIQFVEKTPTVETETPPASVLSDVKLTSGAYSSDITKVTLTATAPHPGYGFEVASIEFQGGNAIVNYRALPPDPDKMYAQVLTEVTAVAYIPASYKPVLGTDEWNSSVSSPPSEGGASGSTGFPIYE